MTEFLKKRPVDQRVLIDAMPAVEADVGIMHVECVMSATYSNRIKRWHLFSSSFLELQLLLSFFRSVPFGVEIIMRAPCCFAGRSSNESFFRLLAAVRVETQQKIR